MVTIDRGRAIAAGLVAFLLLLGAAVRRDERVDLLNQPAQHIAPNVSGVIATDWLPTEEARRDIEARTADVLRVAGSHGSGMRILATHASLRLRSDGARLGQPLARFERSVEITAPRDGETVLRAALSSIEVKWLPEDERHLVQRRDPTRRAVHTLEF